MAVQDKRLMVACSIVDAMPSSTLKKSRQKDVSRAFLYALSGSMDPLPTMMLDKGFPVNVNYPVFGPTHNDPTKLQIPSYFILAVAFGNETVVKRMIRVPYLISKSR
jgi:hypothetical protein